MRISTGRVTLGGLLLAAILSGFAYEAVGKPAQFLLFEYGCGDAEDRLGQDLADERVLAAGPRGVGAGESYRSCDDDDLFVVAGASYAYQGSQESVLAHYREAAPAQGWRRHSDACYSKPVGGTTAYLTLDGPADGELSVEIIADREGSDWC